MQLHELKPAPGAKRRRRIVGRGRGSGLGKTSGKGHKGQKARSGRGILRSLEGGQVPLIRRIPKLGFNSHRPLLYRIVKVEDLARFEEGTVTAHDLKKSGLVKNIFKPYKILGNGELKKALTVQAYSFSKSAIEKIEKAGGKAQKIDQQNLKEVKSAD